MKRACRLALINPLAYLQFPKQPHVFMALVFNTTAKKWWWKWLFKRSKWLRLSYGYALWCCWRKWAKGMGELKAPVHQRGQSSARLCQEMASGQSHSFYCILCTIQFLSCQENEQDPLPMWNLFSLYNLLEKKISPDGKTRPRGAKAVA